MSNPNWTTICPLDTIVPGTGVCALLGVQQIAIFRPRLNNELFALDNIDPFAQASVLSRGLLAEHQGELWVASPVKKQHFRLRDGHCLENGDFSVTSFPVRVAAGQVQIAV